MKNLKIFIYIVLACLTIVSGTLAQPQYHFQKTYPPPDSGKYEYSFHAVDSWGEVCIAVGNKRNGTIKTIDRNIPMVFRSTDGGVTWIEQDPGLPHSRSDIDYGLTRVQQIDSLNAVVAGGSGMISKTSDGGNTWQVQHLIENHGMYSTGLVMGVNFSDPMTGIIVKSITNSDPNDTGNILTTTDGGNTWLPAAFCPWFFAGECHSDGGESFRAIGASEGPVYITHDNWETIDSTQLIVPLADTVHTFGQCNFLGGDTLVGSGANGGIFYLYMIKSTDGGYNWTQIDVPDSIVLAPVSMTSLDRNIVFCGGTNSHEQIVASTDHGMTWKIVTFSYAADTIPGSIISLTVTNSGESVGAFGGPIPSAASVLARGVPMSSGVASSESLNTDVKIYPNPATEKVSVTFSTGILSILDPLGRNYQLPRNGNSLDVSTLPSGVYFVSDGRSRAKFVKE